MTGSYDVLDKRELRVTDVELADADLSALATTVATVLGLDTCEVLVTDYLDNTLTFDVLRPYLYPHQLVGHSDELLEALRSSAGVTLTPESRVTSNGMLGWIAADNEEMAPALAEAERIAAAIRARIACRVGVFSTGAELVSGQIKDTNWQSLLQALSTVGWDCTHLGALSDDQDLIAGAIRQAADNAFGTVITTGGVGAEAKDKTVEAILSLDPSAATRYTSYFTAGHGRHVKNGVRVAVGTVHGCRVVALPGPNDEVRACLPHLVDGLTTDVSNDDLVTTIATTLRGLLRARMEARHQQ